MALVCLLVFGALVCRPHRGDEIYCTRAFRAVGAYPMWERHYTHYFARLIHTELRARNNSCNYVIHLVWTV